MSQLQQAVSQSLLHPTGQNNPNAIMGLFRHVCFGANEVLTKERR